LSNERISNLDVGRERIIDDERQLLRCRDNSLDGLIDERRVSKEMVSK
jgi:hypothetical protein